MTTDCRHMNRRFASPSSCTKTLIRFIAGDCSASDDGRDGQGIRNYVQGTPSKNPLFGYRQSSC